MDGWMDVDRSVTEALYYPLSAFVLDMRTGTGFFFWSNAQLRTSEIFWVFFLFVFLPFNTYTSVKYFHQVPEDVVDIFSSGVVSCSTAALRLCKLFKPT